MTPWEGVLLTLLVITWIGFGLVVRVSFQAIESWRKAAEAWEEVSKDWEDISRINAETADGYRNLLTTHLN